MPKHHNKHTNHQINFSAKHAKEITKAEKQFLEYILSLMPIDTIEDRKQSLTLIAEMFKGAQIHIKGTTPYEDWAKNHKLPNIVSRDGASSHKSDDKQFAIRGKLFAENLFGTRTRGNGQKYSWFQLERHPAGSVDNNIFNKISNTLLHLVDYLVYKFTGENVGPYGTSKYRETNPCYAEEFFRKELKPSTVNKKYWTNMLFDNPSIEFDLHKEPKSVLTTAKPSSPSMMISTKQSIPTNKPLVTPKLENLNSRKPKKLKED